MTRQSLSSSIYDLSFFAVIGCCQSKANLSPAWFGLGALVQPEAGTIQNAILSGVWSPKMVPLG